MVWWGCFHDHRFNSAIQLSFGLLHWQHGTKIFFCIPNAILVYFGTAKPSMKYDFLPQCPDWQWASPHLLFYGYWGLFSPRVNWSGCKVEHLPPSSASIERMELYHQSFVSLWYDTLLSIDSFTFVTGFPFSYTQYLFSLQPFLLFFVLEVGACMFFLWNIHHIIIL